MIDLHTHTTYSNGTWCVKRRVSLLVITDHDTVKAHLENDYSKYYSGKKY